MLEKSKNNLVSNSVKGVLLPLTFLNPSIVFVHGLMGSSDTWLHKESNIHWPQDLLPQDISDARILQFSYDADILRLWNSDFPSEIDIAAEDMLKYLARIREGTSFEDKKIFFVAHSVGGLVTQAALNISRSSPQEYIKKVGEYIQGIAFLGTPQCGGDFVQWADIGTRMMNMVQNSNMDIVAGLKPRSGVLGVIALLQHDFLVFLRRRREEKSIIHITCFYEELPLETPDVGLVVPKDSAILAAYSCYGMLANHLDMTKFESSDDPSYQDICGELLRWMKPLRANQVVQDPGRDNSFPKGKKMKVRKLADVES